MERLLSLLKDGNARSLTALAIELDTTEDDIRRQLEFLERAGVIRRIVFDPGCAGCGGCSGRKKGTACSGCIPKGGFRNMGERWEVVPPAAK